MSRLCKFYSGICLTTEEKARKNLSQGSRRVLVYILPKRTHNTHIHTPTHPHITKQFTKWNSHNIRVIKYPQYKVSDTFIHKNFTVTHFTSFAVTDNWTNSLYIIMLIQPEQQFTFSGIAGWVPVELYIVVIRIVDHNNWFGLQIWNEPLPHPFLIIRVVHVVVISTFWSRSEY